MIGKAALSRFFITLMLIVALLSLGLGVTAQGAPVKIGIAVAQTGNIALFGQEQVIGARIAEAYFNDLGGINGRPIELVFQDTAGDEAGAINAFQVLINQDQVVAIVGPTLSQQAFAADPIANEAGVPVIAPSNTAGGIPEIGEFIARVSAPVSMVAPSAVKTAIEAGDNVEDVVVLFANNDAFSRSETGVFQATVAEAGLNLAAIQEFQTTDTDFTTQVNNTLAANPDLVIISGLAADSGNLVRQLRELGYEGLIVGGNGLNSANMFPICQQLCDGILVAQAYSPLYDSEINQTFRSIYVEQQEKEPPQFSAQAFAAVQVIVEALIALDDSVGLDTLSLADLRAQLNAQILSGSYDTPLGVLAFTPDGEIIQAQFYVARITMADDGQSGTFEIIAIFQNEDAMEEEMVPEETPEA